MVSKETLIILREQLPSAAATKIQKRLADRGIVKSLSMIWRVLDPNQPEIFSEEIIEEAIKLRDEHLQHIAEIENRILHPQV